MEIKRLEELVCLMEKNGLTHLEIREGEQEVVLSRQAAQCAVPPAAAPVAAMAAAEPAALPDSTARSSDEVLTAPLVGCVYLAPEPDAAPFVKVGDEVKQGQVLCIVEAMKVMNEFVAPRDGRVSKVLAQDGQLVEYGQPLFQLQ